MDKHYLYLFLNIATITYPLAQSYEKKLRFLANWSALLKSILFPAIIYIIWDQQFTHLGVWGFNPNYLCGLYIYDLPIEECLFFLTVPFACVFIYEVQKFFLKDFIPFKTARLAFSLFACFLFLIALINLDNLYTSISFGLATVLIFILVFITKTKQLGNMLLTYLICLVPFFFVNGILTGSFIMEPVVWYNQTEHLGLRIGTIPVEDSIYLLGLLLLNFSIYDQFKKPSP